LEAGGVRGKISGVAGPIPATPAEINRGWKMATATATKIRIGPQDNGRRMSLAKFSHAEGEPGYLYELARGVVVVMDVPKLPHGLQVDNIRWQIDDFRHDNPTSIYYVAGGGDCKIELPFLQSERHPDLAIYLFPPHDEQNLWSTWIPDIVIEVVSLGSELRLYEEKREEYLRFAIKEYWIFNLKKREMLVLRRHGDSWEEQRIHPPGIYKTLLLPGLKFSCAAVFRAAEIKSRQPRRKNGKRSR
jgi:Uma2 family endonuclease